MPETVASTGRRRASDPSAAPPFTAASDAGVGVAGGGAAPSERVRAPLSAGDGVRSAAQPIAAHPTPASPIQVSAIQAERRAPRTRPASAGDNGACGGADGERRREDQR